MNCVKLVTAAVLGLGCVTGAGAQTVEEMLGVVRLGEFSFDPDGMLLYEPLYLFQEGVYVHSGMTQVRAGGLHYDGYAYEDHILSFSFTLKDEGLSGFSDKFEVVPYEDRPPGGIYTLSDFSGEFSFSFTPYGIPSAPKYGQGYAGFNISVYGYDDGSRNYVGGNYFFEFDYEGNGSYDITGPMSPGEALGTFFKFDSRYLYYLIQVEYFEPVEWYTSESCLYNIEYNTDYCGMVPGYLAGEFSIDIYGHTLVYGDLATTVPEPETYAMLLAGLGIVGMVARRWKAKVN